MFAGTGKRKLTGQLALVGGVDAITLTGAYTLDEQSSNMLNLDPGGASRDVTLPLTATSDGCIFWIFNSADADEDLVIKDTAAATIATIPRSGWAMVGNEDGTSWLLGASGVGTAGLLLAQAGTAAAPSYSYADDPDTGWYNLAANTQALAIGGVLALALGTSAPTAAAATDVAGADLYIKAPDAGGTATTAKAGGLASVKAGAGSTGTTTVAGGVGGAVVITGGAGGAKTGTGAAAGGASGAVTIATAAGGATASSGADAGGAAGTLSITGAAGGAASAGTGNGGKGSSIVLTPGAGGTSAGGTAGRPGVIIERGVKLVKQGTPTAKTTSATLTTAEVLAGIITVAQGGAGASAQQLPTCADLDIAFPDAAVDDAFDFTVINTSVVDAEDASITTNTGWTLVGSMDVHAYSAAGSLNSSARFRARKTGAAAWTLYRMA